ncbi:MAG: cyclopropane-fatty-acyl-phospholipid synthase family protein [Candidatus Pacebacteria bacterium]|nr:cyclopropane-fatty-acyl-phospholipid synthase family protein [Candidatus Paceibacterota bacterium]MCF7863101.1 cyclopropane-fatty-acyl-phospholipid synthase family protein [Candidatus Paceibacterota bacterium]
MNYIRVIDKIFNQFNGPKFSIRFWNGEEHYYGRGESVVFSMIISDVMTAKRLLTQGSIGFGEAYVDERIKIEGDIESYLRLRHQFKKRKFSLYLAIAVFFASRNIPHSRQEQIAQHYDIGNSFFELILDKETMSYSAGLYKNGSEILSVAQKNKIDFICKWLNLPNGSNVLDLGSGWGGFAKSAAENFHWKVRGYTLSNAQLDYCQRITKENNLTDLLSFEYKDISKSFPAFKYDGIVMIESIEHIGQKNIPQFFDKINKILKPESYFVVQSTIRKKIRSVDRWTLKYIFPGGYLPSKEELLDNASKAGFAIEEVVDDHQDYIYTVTEWIKNFENNREEIENMFNKKFYRTWELWLYGTKVSFEMGAIGLIRLNLKKKQ